jgi:hypothetical protein
VIAAEPTVTLRGSLESDFEQLRVAVAERKVETVDLASEDSLRVGRSMMERIVRPLRERPGLSARG